MDNTKQQPEPVISPYATAFEDSHKNREKLMASRFVGCYSCVYIFAPKSIRMWTDEDQTAICPVCGIDSVVPLSKEQFDSDFLEETHNHWFPTRKRG